MEKENDKDPDKSTDDINREVTNNFEEAVEGSDNNESENPPSPELYDQLKQKAKPSTRKRHFVDENPRDPSKRRRTDIMQLIVQELERRFGPNWPELLPCEILYSEEAGILIMELYHLMDPIAQDRTDQIRKSGIFVQEGYSKNPNKKGKPISSIVNTIVGSVQWEDHIEVGFYDKSKMKTDKKTGEYNHIDAGFIRPRARPIELNDQDIEMDPAEINRNPYIGDDYDEDIDLKKNLNPKDQK